jgi:primosomal protein N' (replication factor Y)
VCSVAEVALRIRTQRTYDYAIPEDLRGQVGLGARVSVPYGRSGRLVEGWCLAVSEQPWRHTLKPIADVVGVGHDLSPKLIELARWVSDYYVCAPGLVLDGVVPTAARQARGRPVRYVKRKELGDGRRITDRQQALLDALGEAEVAWAELRRRRVASPATLAALERRGLVSVSLREAMDEGDSADGKQPCPEDDFTLTDAQAEALNEMAPLTGAAEAAFAVTLLFGVPGSGKTEVYVRAIRRVIARGRQTILLVPEIALATQIVDRLSRRFERVAVLHSRLKPSVRARTFARIAAGAVDVVIGTRTAVFAPCPNLGLIAVDEEQETSLKNIGAPFYHARDVAVKRAQIESIPVVLGSATPSLETWFNAARGGSYRLLRLDQRVPGARPPQVRLVASDRRATIDEGQILCAQLRDQLRACVSQHEQAILLHNRRGFSAHLRCAACGLRVLCPRCNLPLVHHSVGAEMKCHRCGHRAGVPKRCLDNTCGGPIERSGWGIQRLEAEVARLAPDARVIRLDSDTMKRREDYARALRAFADRQADILLGTQMVAKGLDFPDVRLVGVIDADEAIWYPDFRAAERAFQLLVQVAGRAGRRSGESLAILQATDIDQPVLRHAVRMDYESFAAEEMEHRRALSYPPLARMVRCVCSDPHTARARVAAERLSTDLREVAGRVSAGIVVDEPEACVAARRRDRARYQVMLRVPRDVSVRALLSQARSDRVLSPRVERFIIDVDPIDMS